MRSSLARCTEITTATDTDKRSEIGMYGIAVFGGNLQFRHQLRDPQTVLPCDIINYAPVNVFESDTGNSAVYAD